jgi:DNA-directed RNA polymerase specialized sigma24 family protein
MSKYNDKTTMGGGGNVFQTTCWVDVRKARTIDEAQRKDIINDLLGKYWRPVYCYLRHKGYGNESAKDLTQGFFYEIVLGQELIQKADQTKGRFRTFLLTALEHYVSNVYRKETAKKRMPKGGIVHFDDISDFEDRNVLTTATAEEVFHYTWASNLLDEAISNVKNECYSTGKDVHWQVFEEKVLTPILNNAHPPSLTEISSKYDIDSPSMVSNMLVTVKRRFRAVLKRQLQHFVSSEAEVTAEFNDLLKIVSKSCAR